MDGISISFFFLHSILIVKKENSSIKYIADLIFDNVLFSVCETVYIWAYEALCQDAFSIRFLISSRHTVLGS